MSGIFSSGLSVDELLLLEQSGWEPLEVVSGTCCYAIPPNSAANTFGNRELTHRTRLLAESRNLALSRLRDAGAAAGAAGIVGVQIDRRVQKVPGLDPGVHFTATGTAVRTGGGAAPADAAIFTTHLSGQDTWALLTAGFRPLGIVCGAAVFRSGSEPVRRRDVAELPNASKVVYMARGAAMERMQRQARTLDAAGVVGAQIEMDVDPRKPGPTITFSALGTAIAAAGETTRQPTRIGVPLHDPPSWLERRSR